MKLHELEGGPLKWDQRGPVQMRVLLPLKNTGYLPAASLPYGRTHTLWLLCHRLTASQASGFPHLLQNRLKHRGVSRFGPPQEHPPGSKWLLHNEPFGTIGSRAKYPRAVKHPGGDAATPVREQAANPNWDRRDVTPEGALLSCRKNCDHHPYNSPAWTRPCRE